MCGIAKKVAEVYEEKLRKESSENAKPIQMDKKQALLFSNANNQFLAVVESLIARNTSNARDDYALVIQPRKNDKSGAMICLTGLRWGVQPRQSELETAIWMSASQFLTCLKSCDKSSVYLETEGDTLMVNSYYNADEEKFDLVQRMPCRYADIVDPPSTGGSMVNAMSISPVMLSYLNEFASYEHFTAQALETYVSADGRTLFRIKADDFLVDSIYIKPQSLCNVDKTLHGKSFILQGGDIAFISMHCDMTNGALLYTYKDNQGAIKLTGGILCIETKEEDFPELPDGRKELAKFHASSLGSISNCLGAYAVTLKHDKDGTRLEIEDNGVSREIKFNISELMTDEDISIRLDGRVISKLSTLEFPEDEPLVLSVKNGISYIGYQTPLFERLIEMRRLL